MADTIEEYLVGLGFKVDAQSKQRFDDALAATSKTVVALGASLEAAAAAIYATTLKIAEGLDRVFFTAQRANTTTAHLEALGYGFEQLGGTVEQAKAAVGSFFQFVRSNPGAEQAIRVNFGVQTRDAAGNPRDAHDVFMDFMTALRKRFGDKGYAVAERYAAAYGGVSGSDFALVYNNIDKLKAAEAEQAATVKRFGVDPNKAAEAANKLMTSVRELKMELGALLDKMAEALGPKLEGYLNQFSTWIDTHQDDIVAFVNQILDGAAHLLSQLGDIAKALTPLWQGLDETAKRAGKDGAVQAAFESLVLFVAGTWSARMLGAIGGVNYALIAMLAYLGAVKVHDIMSNLVGGGLDAINKQVGYDPTNGGAFDVEAERNKTTLDRSREIVASVRSVLPTWLGGDGGASYWEITKGAYDPARKPLAPSSPVYKGRVWESFNFWLGKGFTPEQAAGLVANEMHETGMRNNPVGDGGTAYGIGQWHADRAARIKAGTGIDVRSADHADQLAAMWWEMNNGETAGRDAVKDATTAGQAAARFSTKFERPKATIQEERMRAVTAEKILADYQAGVYTPGNFTASPDANAAMQARANAAASSSAVAAAPVPPLPRANPGVAGAPTMNQTNTITIHGAGDPRQTADEIERSKKRLDAQMIMNMRGIVH